MSDLTHVYAYVDARREEFVDLLLRYLRQPSISTQDVGVEVCAELVLGMMRDCGLEARLLPTAGKPVVFGQRAVDPGRRTVLIYGHYDVQPVDPLEAWETPPFEPTIRNGRIYARGAGDNKGQHLAQLLAVRSYLATEGALPVNVKVILEGEEESSSPHLARFVEEHRELLAADLVYTSDGPVHESGRPQVVLGVRGILYVELRARGPKSDLHSGNRGGVVPNPAWRLVEVLASMRDAHGRATIEGFYDDVRPLTAAESAAIARLPLDLAKVFASYGVTRLPPPEGLGYYERLMAQPTLNICGFASGYSGEGMKTIIPATATAKLDMRLVPDQDPDDVFEKLTRHVRERAPDVAVARLGSMLPSRTPIENPYTQAVIAAVAEATGEEPLVVPSLGGSLPDYVFTRILGLPSVTVPYANPDESNHAPNENLEIERYLKGIKICATVLRNVGAPEPATAAARGAAVA
jgi:acetylornithine deacetylase/succinyl-diaminopimelate desuccinylase-like protein